MQSIDHIMKQKLSSYSAAKGQLQQLERKKQYVQVPGTSPTLRLPLFC